MQIIVLEYDVRYNNEIRENLGSELKILSENFSIKEDEVNFLKQNINSDESDKEKEQIFYNEINKIRDMLKEKTAEIIKMDQKQNQKNNENSEKVNQINEMNISLVEENEKMKEIFRDVLSFHAEGKTKELNKMLNFLQNNSQIFFGGEENEQIKQAENKQNLSEENEKNNSGKFFFKYFS